MGDIIEIVGIIPFSLKRRFPGPISIPVLSLLTEPPVPPLAGSL